MGLLEREVYIALTLKKLHRSEISDDFVDVPGCPIDKVIWDHVEHSLNLNPQQLTVYEISELFYFRFSHLIAQSAIYLDEVDLLRVVSSMDLVTKFEQIIESPIIELLEVT